DGLPSRTGVAADEALDVDRGPRHKELQRLGPAHVAHPTLYAELLLRKPLIEEACPFRDHRLLGRGQRARLVSEALDGGLVAVRRNQRRQCLHEVPRRADHPRLVAPVEVPAWSATPALAAGHHPAFDAPF